MFSSMSNSKLTSDQLAQRKLWISELPMGSSFAISEDGVTVLCVPEGNVVSIATSIMGADEQKFRRKVGEYHALARYFASECTILPYDTFPSAEAFVESAFSGSFMQDDEGNIIARCVGE